jgi:hypothetical protein
MTGMVRTGVMIANIPKRVEKERKNAIGQCSSRMKAEKISATHPFPIAIG